ncbi:uncharacterized protein A4U43_C03F21100 [Asparagus officinalis]|uniref:PWWP domain-containing protein n=1 Tax=Asparagus officinalis TaxID=4686 RepID=A0A5P1FG33_ASPOF|nr:uncharacterized protein LOC109832288 [Asparagus officinalis]XP_020255300.1 uncharacterized protein LOC109832288 [Asparagus officinalis]XP_020255301.1 uncharacterized protein LOC109832288 [Asparagus officinalis]ONK75839.1 uncharacterized protein A4U43_C03F21100 [Asparagus officinalis]
MALRNLANVQRTSRRNTEDLFLVAFFGDRTFAWLPESQLKHLQENFSKMEKKSRAVSFVKGVDEILEEVSTHVKLGMTCECFVDETYTDLKKEKVDNSGIRRRTSRPPVDRSIIVNTFQPNSLLEQLWVYAQCPLGQFNRLELRKTVAQLKAFKHSKNLKVEGKLVQEKTEEVVDEKCSSREEEVADEEYSSSKEMLAQLCLLARDPTGGYSFIPKIIRFFTTFRAYRLSSYSKYPDPLGRTRGSKRKAAGSGPSYSLMYSDIVLQGKRKGSSQNKVQKKKKTIEKETPTALVLYFNEPDALPSAADLIEFYISYGPLIVERTEIQIKENCAQVVFKYSHDAEEAFHGQEIHGVAKLVLCP